MDVHIAAIEYTLPDRAVSLDDLAKEGRLGTAPEALRSFGFEQAWIAGSEADQLAPRAVTHLLERASIDPASIDILLYAGATPTSHAVGNGLLGGFSYPAARLQYNFGLVNARTIGVSQTGCLGLMTAVSMARAFLVANQGISRVLCVSVDVLPDGSRRDILQPDFRRRLRGPGRTRIGSEPPRRRAPDHEGLLLGLRGSGERDRCRVFSHRTNDHPGHTGGCRPERRRVGADRSP